MALISMVPRPAASAIAVPDMPAKITERMHYQRMTVFDLPMSYVYGGVAFGCFLMLMRQAINVWRNARTGWSRPDDVTHQIAAD